MQRESVIKVQDGVHVVVCKACVVKLAFLVAGHYHHLFFVFCQNPTQLVYLAKYEKYVDRLCYLSQFVGLYELWRRAKTRLR